MAKYENLDGQITRKSALSLDCAWPIYVYIKSIHHRSYDVSVNRFQEDILTIVRKAISVYGNNVREELDELGSKLIELHKINRVKVNHSVMEIMLGAYLIDNGYEVDVEQEVGDSLVADVVAYRGRKRMIIEIETGFTSPENALDPQSYLTARIISKVARYGKHADIFSFATPLHNILQIPPFYLKPFKKRKRREIVILKNLCDKYYPQTSIALEEIRESRINSIYLLNIDTLEVSKLTLMKYLRLAVNKLAPRTPAIKKYIEWSQHSEQEKG